MQCSQQGSPHCGQAIRRFAGLSLPHRSHTSGAVLADITVYFFQQAHVFRRYQIVEPSEGAVGFLAVGELGA